MTLDERAQKSGKLTPEMFAMISPEGEALQQRIAEAVDEVTRKRLLLQEFFGLCFLAVTGLRVEEVELVEQWRLGGEVRWYFRRREVSDDTR